MSTLQLSVNDHLATVQLDRGRSNPINHEMIRDIISMFQSLEKDDAVKGVLLTGKEGFFSSGIDLIEAYEYDEKQSREFWSDFVKMQTVLVSFKKPTVAAISGHSPAGGCILTICCDYRVMVEGPFIIGLNEIPVGIIVPESVFSVYSFWLGQRIAYQALTEGKLFNVAEALKTGLIDEVTTSDNLIRSAEKKAHLYMQFNPATWQQSKLNLRAGLIDKLNSDQSETLDKMLQQWWSPGVRKGLEAMITNLKSKSK